MGEHERTDARLVETAGHGVVRSLMARAIAVAIDRTLTGLDVAVRLEYVGDLVDRADDEGEPARLPVLGEKVLLLGRELAVVRLDLEPETAPVRQRRMDIGHALDAEAMKAAFAARVR